MHRAAAAGATGIPEKKYACDLMTWGQFLRRFKPENL
jgi:hypothetical protein